MGKIYETIKIAAILSLATFGYCKYDKISKELESTKSQLEQKVTDLNKKVTEKSGKSTRYHSFNATGSEQYANFNTPEFLETINPTYFKEINEGRLDVEIIVYNQDGSFRKHSWNQESLQQNNNYFAIQLKYSYLANGFQHVQAISPLEDKLFNKSSIMDLFDRDKPGLAFTNNGNTDNFKSVAVLAKSNDKGQPELYFVYNITNGPLKEVKLPFTPDQIQNYFKVSQFAQRVIPVLQDIRLVKSIENMTGNDWSKFIKRYYSGTNPTLTEAEFKPLDETIKAASQGYKVAAVLTKAEDNNYNKISLQDLFDTSKPGFATLRLADFNQVAILFKTDASNQVSEVKFLYGTNNATSPVQSVDTTTLFADNATRTSYIERLITLHVSILPLVLKKDSTLDNTKWKAFLAKYDKDNNGIFSMAEFQEILKE